MPAVHSAQIASAATLAELTDEMLCDAHSRGIVESSEAEMAFGAI